MIFSIYIAQINMQKDMMKCALATYEDQKRKIIYKIEYMGFFIPHVLVCSRNGVATKR